MEQKKVMIVDREQLCFPRDRADPGLVDVWV